MEKIEKIDFDKKIIKKNKIPEKKEIIKKILEKPLENPGIEKQRLQLRIEKENRYRKSVKAVEALYEMSLRKGLEKNRRRIYELIDTIGALRSFKDYFTEVVGPYGEVKFKSIPQFFETLPILNKMAKIYENFISNSFSGFHTRSLSEDASYIFYHGLLAVNEELLAQLDKQKMKDFFELLKLLLTSQDDFAIEETVNFLNRYKNFFEKLSEEKHLPDIKQKFEELLNFLKTRKFEQVLVAAVQKGINARKMSGKQKIEIKYCEGLLKQVLEKYGLNPEEIIDTWGSYHAQHGPEPNIQGNMEKIFYIEDERKGIASFLYKEFGIRNFERYPASVLIAQFDESKNTEKPYGIIMQATHDWNGAFGSWKAHLWHKLFEQIKDRYAIRIIEAKSKIEVARRLISLDKKYGSHHKISFSFIGGHGTKDSILFGGSHARNRLVKEDLAGRGAQRTHEFFEIHPIIILISCSTGAEGGIGQELSRMLDAKVIAPPVPTNIKDINAILTNNGIDFKVEYEGREGSPSGGKVYSAGQKEETEN